MPLRRSTKRADAERYRQAVIRVAQVEFGGHQAVERLREVLRAGAALSEVRAAYRAIGTLTQEPLPAQPALDPQRPHELTRRLSTLRTRRQWYLMGAPPGLLPPQWSGRCHVRRTGRTSLVWRRISLNAPGG